SHELKTPMAIIQAHAEALSEGAFHDEVMGPKFVDALLRNSERLNTIVSSMLELAHLESGTYDLFLSMYEIEPLIENSIELFQDTDFEHSYQITIDVEKDLKAYIDVQAFSHIVHNFVENAIKYTSRKGIIRVKGKQTDDGVRVSVEDNGPGIESKYFSRIFERFFRIDKGRARDEGGTGLGLSIVRNMADAMGAQVGVCNSELGGAEFWCLFPNVH
ncbi:MAG: histidine kinase, partial [Deltaproteobacteria bacterium]|nr:histidine kinase [Deltaproteobacteria bacterium]